MYPKITIVGLGFGDEDSLSLGTWKCLQRNDPLFLRTADHPITPWLKQHGLIFTTFDDVYEQHDQFAPVYEEMKEQLFQAANEHGPIVYAVPGHPMVAERTVQLLLQEGSDHGVKIEVLGGGSFLDIVFARLAIDPVEGFQLLDGSDVIPSHELVPTQHILISQVYSKLVASEVKLTLMQVYPDDYEVTIANALGIKGLETIQKVPLYELDRVETYTNLTSIYVPPAKEASILYKQFSYLVNTMQKLRSPEGCPWDQVQSHQSLRPYLIEEAYELLDAIEQQDDEAMLEELGDVLLQVIFHAVLAKERYAFTIEEVIETLTKKLIRRHPHVFGTGQAETPEEVKQTWDAIKQQEGKRSPTSVLDDIPKSFPTIISAYEQQKEAAKVGFDFDHVDQVLAKLMEELTEFSEATGEEHREEELGDVIYSIINVARFYKIDPEVALRRTTRKFDRRFRYVEQQAKQTGQPLSSYSMDQLEIWWQAAKQLEKEANQNEIG
jgi:tetrapyrrole methylase family protein/MazG family protein